MTTLRSHFCRNKLRLCRYVVLTSFHNVTNICKPLGICYAKLFEAAIIHVQIMRFTHCLNMAFT